MGTMASPASPLFTQPFIQAQIKENVKAPCHWPLCGEFTGNSAQMASNAANVSIWWRHHDLILPEYSNLSTQTCPIFHLRISAKPSIY